MEVQNGSKTHGHNTEAVMPVFSRYAKPRRVANARCRPHASVHTFRKTKSGAEIICGSADIAHHPSTPLMSDLRRCMQASNSDSDTDESSSDSGQSPRKRRKEKREHTHKRSPRNDKSRIRKRHKEKKHKRHKERHHRDKIASPRHKERHHIDKVASPRSIDKEAKSPRSVMADPKSGMFCPQKSRVLQESEAVAERRLAAAKHCAEQRETASTYQAVVTVAPPVQWSRERARAALASRPFCPFRESEGCLGKPTLSARF